MVSSFFSRLRSRGSRGDASVGAETPWARAGCAWVCALRSRRGCAERVVEPSNAGSSAFLGGTRAGPCLGRSVARQTALCGAASGTRSLFCSRMSGRAPDAEQERALNETRIAELHQQLREARAEAAYARFRETLAAGHGGGATDQLVFTGCATVITHVRQTFATHGEVRLVVRTGAGRDRDEHFIWCLDPEHDPPRRPPSA